MDDMISVIVPIYNVSNYLNRCLDSILNQSYKKLQIVLVDDGSTDASKDICDVYASKDERVEVIHKPNEGLVSARKAGLEKSTGKYIGFVDGDDYIDFMMYERLETVIRSHNADIVHSDFFSEDGLHNSGMYKGNNNDEFVIEVNSLEKRIQLLNDCFLDKHEGLNLTPSIWSKLFKADFIKNVYSRVPDNQSYGEDVICLYLTLCQCEKIVATRECYYHYAVRNNSMSHIYGNKLFVNELSLANSLCEVHKNMPLQIDDAVFYQYIRRRLLNGLAKTASVQTKYKMPQFYYAQYKVLCGKNVVIYGAGDVGHGYLHQLEDYGKCRIVAMIDQNADRIKWQHIIVKKPADIKSIDYDFILIAINDAKMAENIRRYLIREGVLKEKILWNRPEC